MVLRPYYPKVHSIRSLRHVCFRGDRGPSRTGHHLSRLPSILSDPKAGGYYRFMHQRRPLHCRRVSATSLARPCLADARCHSAASVWNDNGIGTYLDTYLSSNGESGWLNKLASETFPGSGNTGSFGCGSRDQPCMAEVDDCAAMAADGRSAEYWTFNAVRNMQVYRDSHRSAYPCGC